MIYLGTDRAKLAEGVTLHTNKVPNDLTYKEVVSISRYSVK